MSMIYSQLSELESATGSVTHWQPQATLSASDPDSESLEFNRLIIPVLRKSLDGDASLALEKSHYNCHHMHDSSCERRDWHGQTSLALLLVEHHDTTQASSCHNLNIRLRRFILPAIFVFVLALGGLLAWNCVNDSMPVPRPASSWRVKLMGRTQALGDNLNRDSTPIIQTRSSDLSKSQFAPLTHSS